MHLYIQFEHDKSLFIQDIFYDGIEGEASDYFMNLISEKELWTIETEESTVIIKTRHIVYVELT